jgi:hypothetical protein
MTKAKCCAIRDASKGMKGACRRPALVHFTACCCEEHEASLLDLTPTQGEKYKRMLQSSRSDCTGIVISKMNDLRELILSSQLNILRKRAAELTLDIEEELVEAAERDKADRKAAEQSDKRLVLNGKRAALFRSQSLTEEPVSKSARGGRSVATVTVNAESSSGTDDDDDDEQEQEQQQYGANADGRDADAAYMDVLDNALPA